MDPPDGGRSRRGPLHSRTDAGVHGVQVVGAQGGQRDGTDVRDDVDADVALVGAVRAGADAALGVEPASEEVRHRDLAGVQDLPPAHLVEAVAERSLSFLARRVAALAALDAGAVRSRPGVPADAPGRPVLLDTAAHSSPSVLVTSAPLARPFCVSGRSPRRRAAATHREAVGLDVVHRCSTARSGPVPASRAAE